MLIPFIVVDIALLFILVFALEPLLAEVFAKAVWLLVATKFELNDEGNLVYRCKGKKRTHDIVDFNINVVSIPFSCLMVTVESEQE